MKANYQLEWKDYLAAQWLHIRPHPIVRVILLILGILVSLIIALSLLMLLIGNNRLLGLNAPVIILVGGGLYYYRVMLPNTVKRIFLQNAEWQSPFEIEVTPQDLRQMSVIGETLRPWSHFQRWKEDAAIFVLYLTDYNFILLPKRAFPDPAPLTAIKQHVGTQPRPTAVGTARQQTVRFYIVLIILLAIIVALTWPHPR